MNHPKQYSTQTSIDAAGPSMSISWNAEGSSEWVIIGASPINEAWITNKFNSGISFEGNDSTVMF